MRLRQRFLTGLVTLLPLLVTLYFLAWVYTYSGGYIQSFLRLLNLEVPRTYQPLLPFVGLFLAGVLIYLVGTVAENYLGRRLIVSLERSSPSCGTSTRRCSRSPTPSSATRR